MKVLAKDLKVGNIVEVNEYPYKKEYGIVIKEYNKQEEVYEAVVRREDNVSILPPEEEVVLIDDEELIETVILPKISFQLRNSFEYYNRALKEFAKAEEAYNKQAQERMTDETKLHVYKHFLQNIDDVTTDIEEEIASATANLTVRSSIYDAMEYIDAIAIKVSRLRKCVDALNRKGKEG